MNKENVQWLVLVLVIVGLVGLGAMMFNQNAQLTQVSRSLVGVASQVQELSENRGVTSQPSIEASAPTAAQGVQTATETNIFDPFMNKVGDVVAGLKIISIGGVPGIQRPMAKDNVLAKFSGRVTLSGMYDYDMNAFAGDEMVCFQPANSSERMKIPVLAGEPDQNTRFCFSNIEKAKVAFGPKYGKGQATIIIDNYELWYAPAEVVNQAELLNVTSKQPVSEKVVTLSSPQNGASYGKAASVKITGKTKPGYAIQVYINENFSCLTGNTYSTGGAGQADTNGNFSFPIAEGLIKGKNTLVVAALDEGLQKTGSSCYPSNNVSDVVTFTYTGEITTQ